MRVLPLGWKIPWRRAWQPTRVFLFGEFHAQRSLVGYRPWGHKESDTTERLSTRAGIAAGSHRAAPIAFPKLLSISLKPTDVRTVINPGETGKPRDASLSRWGFRVTLSDHQAQLMKYNVWWNSWQANSLLSTGQWVMDGPVMMDSSSLTLSPWILVQEIPLAGAGLSQR